MRFHSYMLSLAVAALASGGFPAAAFAATGAEARAEVQRAREGADGLRTQQHQLRTELNEVAGRIEELKAQQRGRLLPGGELPALLRRSQELSGSLTAVEASLARAEAEVQQRSAALVDALDGEVEAARASLDSSSREARRGLMEKIRALRRERDQLRSQLPAGRLPQVKGQDSDDPVDLLEQADTLRDTQDKVAARLKALDRRIAELKREQELDRRMGEFLDEEHAFDERDRRFGGARETGGQVELQSFPGPEGVPRGAPGTADGQTGTTAFGDRDGSGALRGTARDARGQPQMGLGSSLPPGGDDELSALTKQRQELEAMSKELGVRAGDLERRARELK